MSANLECGACGSAVRDAHLCNRCTDQLRTDLLRASLAARDLRRSYLRQDVQTVGRTGKPQKAKYTPLPWSEVARTVLTDLETLVSQFATPASAGTPVEETLMHLASATWLRQDPRTGELLAGLTAILARADSATDRREDTWIYGTCTSDGTILEASITANRVTCPQCNTGYDAGKLRTAQWEAVNGSLVTQAEAAKLLHLQTGAPAEQARLNINRWVDRGVIADHAGYVLYGDVRERWIKGAAMRAKKAIRARQVSVTQAA